MSINDEDNHEERQMNISRCQIDTHHNMAKIYVQNLKFNRVCQWLVDIK